MKKDFIKIEDYSKEELLKIINLSLEIKKDINDGYYPPLLANKNLGMIFEAPSTRTRCSLESAMNQLGGHGQYLGVDQLQLGNHENLSDTARVLSGLEDVISVRTGEHSKVETLAKYSKVPVINAMSNNAHPTQVIADVITIIEHLPEGKKFEDLKISFVGDGTQVCASLAMISTKLGAKFIHYGPKGAKLKDDVYDVLNKTGLFVFTDNKEEIRGSDFVYTDVWCGVHEHQRSKEERVNLFKDYQVNSGLMEYIGGNCKFMHCLPAIRGEEVSDEVIDSTSSICFEESDNRLTAMRGILVYLTYTPKKENFQSEKLNRLLKEL